MGIWWLYEDVVALRFYMNISAKTCLNILKHVNQGIISFAKKWKVNFETRSHFKSIICLRGGGVHYAMHYNLRIELKPPFNTGAVEAETTARVSLTSFFCLTSSPGDTSGLIQSVFCSSAALQECRCGNRDQKKRDR